MKKLLIAFLFFFVMSAAYAQVDTSGLSKQQQAELTIQAEKMKEDGKSSVIKVTNPAGTVEVVSKWAEAGKSLAVGLGAGAREIGVAVNDFADTRVGKITTYIIIWKLMGKELMGLVMGLFIILIVIPVIWKSFRYLMDEKREYEYYKFLWFIPMRRLKGSSFKIESDGACFAMCVTGAVELGFFITAIKMLPF